MRSLMTAGMLVIGGGAAVAPPGTMRARDLGPADPGMNRVAMQAADTATVRLHISGMTCGSCPATARLALRRMTGVHAATVTLDDSLGVVRYDPRRVTPPQIAAHLTRLTGYRATILPDSTKASRRPTGS